MKKIFLFLALSSLVVTSCKDDNETTTTPEVSIETQNSYDDEAAQKFLKDNYFDSRGNIVAFSTTSTTDDNEKPLFDYNPVKLPSGVIYISRYTPNNGKVIATTDKLKIMQKTTSYVANKVDNVIKYESAITFRNNITLGTGTPEYDPSYYFVKEKVLKAYNDANSKTYTKTFYEIEGFQEGIKYFQSCELNDSENYNLQGVIIVPSRAAFARDEHYPYIGSMRNKSLVFNFQIYKTETRLQDEY